MSQVSDYLARIGAKGGKAIRRQRQTHIVPMRQPTQSIDLRYEYSVLPSP